MRSFYDFIHRPITLRTVEMCTYVTRELVVSEGVYALVRQRTGLPCGLSERQMYLHLRTVDGLEGWYGPLTRWSNVTGSTLAVVLRLLGRNISIAGALKVLKPLWPRNPTSCAAVDCALWDLICRSERLRLWRAIAREGSALKRDPPFYGSALGLALEHVGVLVDVLAAGYPLAKWALNAQKPIEEQLSKIMALHIGWDSIALDAHGGLSVAQVKRIYHLAPGLCWLEDPFSSEDDHKWTRAGVEGNKRLPRLIVGEDVDSPERLEELAAYPAVHAVNLEVERLGVTRAILVIRSLKAQGRVCHLHGRALVPSSHLAIAYPDVARWVEIHLAFALERLATVRRGDSAFDPREIVRYCLEREGLGVEPRGDMDCFVPEILL